MANFKKSIAIILVLCLMFGVMNGALITASASDAVSVEIVSFRRGAQDDLRSSELLEARVTGYNGNVRELTYKWYNELGTYVYVYNSHNMYGINNTDGEIEIYNDSVSTSENMSGRSYKDTYSGVGFAWAAVYGANLTNDALVGTLTVEVYDENGKLLATDSHEGRRERTGSFLFFPTYTYYGFVNYDLEEDLHNIAFGLFEDDTRTVKNLLGESSIVHITCSACSVSDTTIASGKDVISISSDGSDFYITGLKKGTGVAKVSVQKDNCKFHQTVEVDTQITVYVYEKPETTATTHSITINNIDPDCTYYIGGNAGERKENGTIVFENLTPNTNYEIEVVGHAEGTKPVYAYVYQTTLPVHPATVKVFLDGGIDSNGVPYGTLTNIEDILGEGAKIYLREENTDTYYELTNTSAGEYTTNLSDGTYFIYYAQNDSARICDQQVSINGAGRTRDLFFYSVTYNPNGGTFESDSVTYHHNDHSALVSSVVPYKEGYDFLGWMDEDNNLYQPGAVLTDYISKPYILTAQWEKTKYANVNLNLVINHTYSQGDVSGTDPNPGGSMEIDLVYRQNDSEPYVEYVGKDIAYDDWYETGTHTESQTQKSYEGIFTGLSKNYEYSANVFLDDYYVTDSKIETLTDQEGNILYDVTIYLNYSPDLFKLHYNIVADESVPDDLIPTAVDMKVLSWDANLKNAWAPISRHEEYSADVNFSGRQGESSYSVPVHKNEETDEHYLYRVAAVGFTLKDGTELTASGTDGVNYYSDAASSYGKGAYYAVVSVENGTGTSGTALSGSKGVKNSSGGFEQSGTITVTVYANRYDVIFNSQGGSSVESIQNVFTIPDASGYVPTKPGYTFAGWYMNADCTAGNEVIAGTPITEDTVLYAKWLENKTVSGTVTVSTYYTVNGEEVSIRDTDSAQSILILLQKIDNNGYAITLAHQEVSLSYSGNYGTGTYSFTDLPNDGSVYRIDELIANYTTVFQNASSPSNNVTDYSSYDSSHYVAEFNNSTKATVNAYLHLEPEMFPLEYRLDATAIGEGFRPTFAETFVHYDDGLSGMYPQHWPIIGQMTNGTEYEGQKLQLTDGIANGSYEVWKMKFDGKNLYDYAISIGNYTANGKEEQYTSTSPFTVSYNGTARYSDVNGQTSLLTAVFTPKMYTVSFDLGDVSEDEEITNMDAYIHMDGTFADTYYWSIGKALSAMPRRPGYKFMGWYDENGNKVTGISPERAENFTLYAQWLPTGTFDMFADAGYYAESKDATPQTGVIAFSARLNEYAELGSHILNFGIYIYNDAATQKAQTESANITQLAADDGWYHTIISNISKENMDKKVLAAAFAVIDVDGNPETTDDRETVLGEFISESVANINKWLGTVNPYSN